MAVRVSLRVPAKRRVLLHLLEALARVNGEVMRGRRRIPLYQSGVRYRQEARDRSGNRRDDWLTVPQVLSRGHADCEDLVAYRVWELRGQGVRARPWVYRAGPGTWHVVVKLPGGKIEDPSKVLGMK